MTDETAHVWGTISCSPNEVVPLSVGTLRLSVKRSEHEWSLEYRYDQDRFVRSAEEEVVHARTAFESTDAELALRPAPADRYVVARPAQRLVIPPAQRATLYVSSPVWLQLVTSGGVVLADLTTEILSDTWLGPNTRSGHLAYANETQARMLLDKLPHRPHRMITPITIVNASEAMLDIARLSIPALQLAVYQDADSLWSPPVEVVCEKTLAVANVTIGDEAPDHLQGASHVCDPRVREESNSVTRAIGLLLG